MIDGHRVTVRYAGQQQTCARCHQVPGQCRGKGVARKCEAEGGEKVEFLDYIYDLWARIGHNPSEPVVEEVLALGHDEETGSGQQSQYGTVGGDSVASGQDPALFTGVSIRSFDKNQDQGDIIEFLVTSGLKEQYKDNIKFNARGEVTITEVDSEHCQTLITAFHLKMAPGESEGSHKTLKCNGIIPYTPPKPAKPASSPSSSDKKNENPVDLSNKTLEKIPLQLSSGDESGNDNGEDIEDYKKVKSRKHKLSPDKDENSKKVDTKLTPTK